MQAGSHNRVRSFFWPVYGNEHRKLVPMFTLFFLISFIYNILRCMKVTLVVTASGSSAEVIPFLKVWAVLPGAILLTYLYTKLSNRLNREQVFYAMLAIFLGFFFVFVLFIHPNREALELTRLSTFLQENLPEGLKGLNGFITIIRHWHLTLFYMLSELWGAVVLSMLFWGFANEITSVNEAKRFYAIFALGANSSGILSGQCAQLLTLDHYHPNLPFGSVAWEQSLILQLGLVLLVGLIVVGLFYRVNRLLVPKQTVVLAKKEKPKRPKLSLLECFSHIMKSRYMLYIAVLVVAYNIVYNLSDVLWTEQIRERYPLASDFNAYMNKMASLTGVFATFSALLLSGNVIRRFGWTTTAMLTPALWLITSIGFFGCLLFVNNVAFTDFLGSLFGMPVYMLTLFFGSMQICLGRAAKYTVFDESKEIAFIPLSHEDQRKGKAVVDGIVSRFGKSGGSIIIQVLLVFCGELIFTIPYVAAILFVTLGFWCVAVWRLGQMASSSIDETFQQPLAEGVLASG